MTPRRSQELTVGDESFVNLTENEWQMVKAFQGERFKLPVVGDWAEEQAG